MFDKRDAVNLYCIMALEYIDAVRRCDDGCHVSNPLVTLKFSETINECRMASEYARTVIGCNN